eukprot:6634400-Alexandrium_andersonii.AAC.1
MSRAGSSRQFCTLRTQTMRGHTDETRAEQRLGTCMEWSEVEGTQGEMVEQKTAGPEHVHMAGHGWWPGK